MKSNHFNKLGLLSVFGAVTFISQATAAPPAPVCFNLNTPRAELACVGSRVKALGKGATINRVAPTGQIILKLDSGQIQFVHPTQISAVYTECLYNICKGERIKMANIGGGKLVDLFTDGAFTMINDYGQQVLGDGATAARALSQYGGLSSGQSVFAYVLGSWKLAVINEMFSDGAVSVSGESFGQTTLPASHIQPAN
jgi:hypothetical protein